MVKDKVIELAQSFFQEYDRERMSAFGEELWRKVVEPEIHQGIFDSAVAGYMRYGMPEAQAKETVKLILNEINKQVKT